jgi:anthranilate synthase/aminodeoxychorismate synthase-like glutamine amidotransferase
MILVIDSYDSFTFNLVHLLGGMYPDILVRRNDAIEVDDLLALAPAAIVLSPGPGRPENAGIIMDVIRRYAGPILGVCLGHQAIGQAFGARVVHAPSLVHGRTSMIVHRDTPLYRGVTNPFPATRYHSLTVEARDLPPDLEVTATTDDGIVMGIRHRRLPLEGVQFHPESILTGEGKQIIANWLEGSVSI